MRPVDKDHLRGIWIWGASGAGKSRLAREKFPGSYPKLCNKWWDGYKDELTVIMDDLGKDHKCLGHQLKIWADRYGFIMENKGGACIDNYEWFIVTSQYRIEDIWEGDQETIDAIKRRFEVHHIISYDSDRAAFV